MDWLTDRLLLLVPLVLSLSVHEWAHAWSARRLGDETAERAGRLTLDPTAHIDPVGTLLLPMMGVPFGWAKPVPVDPSRFRAGVDARIGMAAVALAGPLSNVALAVLCLAALGAGSRLAPEWVPARLLITAVPMNVALALFNLLPLFPLDGSRVVEGLLPGRLLPGWQQLRPLGPMLILGLVLGQSALDLRLFDAPMRIAVDWVRMVLPS